MTSAELQEMAKNTIAELDRDLTILNHTILGLTAKLHKKECELEEFERDLKSVQLCSEWIQNLIRRVTCGNKAKIEKTVNDAFRFIFTDRSFEFGILDSIKRGVNTYTFEIREDGVSGNMSSFGGGALAVAAMVLKLLFNIFTGQYPLLSLDESLPFISEKYVHRTGEFLRGLAQEFKMTILLVTHQPLFTEYSDIPYEVRSVGSNTSIIERIT